MWGLGHAIAFSFTSPVGRSVSLLAGLLSDGGTTEAAKSCVNGAGGALGGGEQRGGSSEKNPADGACRVRVSIQTRS